MDPLMASKWEALTKAYGSWSTKKHSTTLVHGTAAFWPAVSEGERAVLTLQYTVPYRDVLVVVPLVETDVFHPSAHLQLHTAPHTTSPCTQMISLPAVLLVVLLELPVPFEPVPVLELLAGNGL